MRRIALLAVLAVTAVWAGGAQAATHAIVPPGNGGIDQYVETVPGVGGSSGVGHHKSTHNSSVGAGTRHQLQQLGANGQGAIAVADATAPTLSSPSSGSAGTPAAPTTSTSGAAVTPSAPSTGGSGKPSGSTGKPTSSGSAPSSSQPVATPTGSSGSPVTEFVRAVTSGTKGEGMGVLQPIVLMLVLLGAGAYVWHRRSRRSA